MGLLTQQPSDRVFKPFLSELKQIFDDMDAAYDDIADHYNFACTGCADNCCRSRFYHHTLLEYFYLSKGLTALSPAQETQILERATRLKPHGKNHRPLCPANLEGRCQVYRFRPMICRLHGVPHALAGPGNTLRCGPGCDEFSHHIGGIDVEVRLERTSMYRRMAQLEKSVRQRVRFTGRIKMTVAQMIVASRNSRADADVTNGAGALCGIDQ